MARLSGLPAIEGLRRAHEILDYCNIGQERYRNVETYSTGMRQRLKFAQALVHDPSMLILDEPTSNLDPEERQALLNRIRWLATNAGKAVLISTHILPDVQAICDTAVIMANGSVRMVERLEVLRRPSAPAYLVRVMGRPDSLAARIREAGHLVETNQQGQLTVHGIDADSVRHIWLWASEIGVGVSALAPVRNSLEDVFLRAIGEHHVADS
jgi:ABC-2 type transport system ATP-binding protein